jgi:hypothetical protein
VPSILRRNPIGTRSKVNESTSFPSKTCWWIGWGPGSTGSHRSTG